MKMDEDWITGEIKEVFFFPLSQ